MNSPVPAPLPMPPLLPPLPARPSPPPPLQAGSQEAALFQELRVVRLGLARERKVPAYRVATDRALAFLCYWHPDSPKALQELPGWGPAMRQKSGDVLWQAMADQAAQLGLPLQPIPPLHDGRPATPAAQEAWLAMDQRLPLLEVAAKTGRKLSTVQGYWLTWLQRRRPTNLEPWLGLVDWQAISAALQEVRQETGTRRLAPVHERLQGRYDFGTLRAVAVLGPPPA